MCGTHHIRWKIDLDPGGPGHIDDLEDLTPLAQQIAHGFFMRHLRTVTLDIARNQRRQAARGG